MTQPAPVVREWGGRKFSLYFTADDDGIMLDKAIDEHDAAIRALRAEVEALTAVLKGFVERLSMAEAGVTAIISEQMLADARALIEGRKSHD